MTESRGHRELDPDNYDKAVELVRKCVDSDFETIKAVLVVEGFTPEQAQNLLEGMRTVGDIEIVDEPTYH